LKDRQRDDVIARKLKAKVIRFTVEEVERDPNAVAIKIRDIALSRPLVATWNAGLRK
jgi:very-short-patch-repair endonuclease